QIEMAKQLLEKGYPGANEKDDAGNSAFSIAAMKGNIGFVKWLIENEHIETEELDKVLEWILKSLKNENIWNENIKLEILNILPKVISLCLKHEKYELLKNQLRPIIGREPFEATRIIRNTFDEMIRDYEHKGDYSSALQIAKLAQSLHLQNDIEVIDLMSRL